MSKKLTRDGVAYWHDRLFRNWFTYRGERREVEGWYVKIQWRGSRRTIRLGSNDRAEAAVEARDLYEQLQRGGWEALKRLGIAGRARGRAESSGTGPQLGDVTLRKYVGDWEPEMAREYFAELRNGEGTVERVGLRTEDGGEAQMRARALRAEVASCGWEALRRSHPREVTVAVWWQTNPMLCTYTTLVTIPAASGPPLEHPLRSRGWRVLVIEPDGSVRRALIEGLRRAPETLDVAGCPSASVVNWDAAWDLVLVNRDLSMAPLRALIDSKREGTREGRARLFMFGVFPDSDAIFASVSGVTGGYFLRRMTPTAWLAPLLAATPDGPPRQAADEDRLVRRFFQSLLEPSESRSETAGAELTARESDVVELLRRGCVDKEIAAELGISIWTVHSHLKRIFAKYGARTRTEVVVRHIEK